MDFSVLLHCLGHNISINESSDLNLFSLYVFQLTIEGVVEFPLND